MSDHFTSWTIALSISEIPHDATEIDDLFELATASHEKGRMVVSVSKGGWIHDVINALGDGGYLPKQKFLCQPSGIAHCDDIPGLIAEVKAFYAGIEGDCTGVVSLLKFKRFSQEEILEAMHVARPSIHPDLDNFDVKDLFNYLEAHVALYEAALRLGLDIIQVQCEEFSGF